MWPDFVIAIAQIFLGYALIPQIYKGFKEKRAHIDLQMGLITTLGLYAIAVSLFALNLFFSSTVTFFNATMWLILFVQSLAYK